MSEVVDTCIDFIHASI